MSREESHTHLKTDTRCLMSDPLATWRDIKCYLGKKRLLHLLDFPEEGAVELRGPSTRALLSQEAGQERAEDGMQICRAGRTGGPQAYVQLLEKWCLQQADTMAAGSSLPPS